MKTEQKSKRPSHSVSVMEGEGKNVDRRGGPHREADQRWWGHCCTRRSEPPAHFLSALLADDVAAGKRRASLHPCGKMA